LLSVCDRVIVVTGFNRNEVEATIELAFHDGNLFPRVDLIYNPDFEKGMFSSLQAGVKAIKDSDWVLYHFVDQPFHEKKFYKDLTDQIDPEFDWIQPVYKGNEGHPVIFNNKVSDLIINSPVESMLRGISKLPMIKKEFWDCNYPKILKDYDTPDDLRK
jgi:molybdenum cofactor cytidylyltransferase